MAGINIGFWDWATFASLAIIVFGFVLLLILIMELPGKIAIAHRHPEADAVRLMGWVGARCGAARQACISVDLPGSSLWTA